MTLEMDLDPHGHLVTSVTASISYITTERLSQPHGLDLLPLENDYNYRAAGGNVVASLTLCYMGPPGGAEGGEGVDLVG